MFHTLFELISISAFCATVLVFAAVVGG